MNVSTSEMQENLRKEAEKKSFYQRNKMSINTLTLALLAGGAFAAVYFTAGTTIPAVVGAATKLGVDLAFLESMSTLAASATIAGAGTAIAATAYKGLELVVNGFSAMFSWMMKPSTPAASSTPDNINLKKEEEEEIVELNSANTISNDVKNINSSTVALVKSLEVEAQNLTKTSPVVSNNSSPAVSQHSSRSNSPKLEMVQKDVIVAPLVNNSPVASNNNSPAGSKHSSRSNSPVLQKDEANEDEVVAPSSLNVSA